MAVKKRETRHARCAAGAPHLDAVHKDGVAMDNVKLAPRVGVPHHQAAAVAARD